jgi:GAF domain-containing protein
MRGHVAHAGPVDRGVHRRHPGVGVRAWCRIAGRVWSQREPAWIPDVTADKNFPRSDVAERVGLHAAFALPIMQGRRVQGVMEFFSQQILQPSPDLLSTMTTICNQIAIYIERLWASEDFDRFFTLSLDLFAWRRSKATSCA